MAHVIEKPRHPVENWESMLDEWVADVKSVIEQAERWAVARGWGTKRDAKTIAEELMGTYEAPRLLVHAPEARFLLDPVARCVVGAAGRFDFCIIPSYDAVPLVKIDGSWRFLTGGGGPRELDWSDESFGKICAELAAMQ